MPTPPPRDDNDSMQFRGPTLEEAIALAEQSLGGRVRVVAANRIRRGGIGGFFASDLGVESREQLSGLVDLCRKVGGDVDREVGDRRNDGRRVGLTDAFALGAGEMVAVDA